MFILLGTVLGVLVLDALFMHQDTLQEAHDLPGSVATACADMLRNYDC
jgi:hypothetical protein